MAHPRKNSTFSDRGYPSRYFAFQAGTTPVPAYVAYEGTTYLWLGCCVARVAYDFPTHTGRAFLLPGHCTDATSVVRYFQLLDPDVCRIETFSGDEPDTVYIRGAKSWPVGKPTTNLTN
jgi:hypothetical protein